jgi:outer membrane protein
MRRWRLAGVLVGVVLTAVSAAPRATAEELTLEQAIERALAGNPALRGVEEVRSEVEAGIREAKADVYPQVEAISFWSLSRSPSLLNSPDFDEFVDNFPGGVFEPREQELTSAGIEVTQPIYTFGKLGAAIDLAEQVAETAEAQIDAARMNTALAAAESYYRVLAAERALATVREQEGSRRQSLSVVQARLDIGEATRLEVLQSQTLLAQLLPDLAAARGRLRQAEADLRAVLDLPPDEPLELRPSAGLTGDPAETLVAPGAVTAADFAALDRALTPEALERGAADSLPALPVLLTTAAERRAELRDLDLQRAVLETRQRISRADGRPQIELTGRYGRQAREVENLGDELFSDWAVAVGLSWELFDGGRRKSEIARLESQRRQLEWQRRDVLNGIRLELERAAADYQTARARERAAEIAAAAAREASRVAEESYREGVALQSEWLDAQQRYTEAEIVRVEAFYDALIEEARLARALGYVPTGDWRRGTVLAVLDGTGDTATTGGVTR